MPPSKHDNVWEEPWIDYNFVWHVQASKNGRAESDTFNRKVGEKEKKKTGGKQKAMQTKSNKMYLKYLQ